MDAFAVSLTMGVSNPKKIQKLAILAGLYFSLFQGLMRLFGYLDSTPQLGKPQELTVMALTRGRFCELMVKTNLPTHSQPSAFLIGLLSLIDAMVDGDIQELMNKLPLHNDMKDAIINRKGESAYFLKLCELFEKADWQNIELFCQQIKVDPEPSCRLFQEALSWADHRNSALN